MWIWIVLIGYFLNTIATLISKWLLIKDIPHPAVFTFYIGVLNMVALVLIPFGFYFPGYFEVMIALTSGITFGLGLFLMSKAMNFDQVSQVAPMVGGLQPIFVLGFVWWFLPETLVWKQYIGIGLLVLGSIMIALEIGKKRLFRKRKVFTASWPYILSSSLFFGLSFALLKLVYIQQDFISGFIWTRIGVFLFVLVLLVLPGNWRKIKKSFYKSPPKSKGWFLFGQLAGAISFLMIAYAISIGPVTIINAMQGIQYAFLFIFIILLMKKYPHLLDEPMTKLVIAQKTIATIIIIIGLSLLV